MIDVSLLKTGVSSLGIDFADECIELIDAFSEMVAEQNKSFNLTALTTPDAFTEKHIVDSLAALPFIPHGSSVCDVGAGAGFPSVPIAIARPDTMVTALDSTAKKIFFIERAANQLGIRNLHTLTARAEECTHERETFDVVTARAVAPLAILSELALPLVKMGGVFIAYKTNSEEMISEKSLYLLGARLKERREYSLPSGDGRVLLVFEKVAPTDADLPRKYGLIKKHPLV